MAIANLTVYESEFWRCVTIRDGCWEWQGPRLKTGYGTFKRKLAHRVAFYLAHGSIPDGMVICHSCDNPRCVRPDHLFCGTQRDNIADMDRKGRRRIADTAGEKNGRARLTSQAVREIDRLRQSGKTYKVIADQFGVTIAAVRNAHIRRSWRTVA